MVVTLSTGKKIDLSWSSCLLDLSKEEFKELKRTMKKFNKHKEKTKCK